MQIIAMLVMAGAGFLFLEVYFLIDHIITGQRLKINQKAWDEYSANMDFDRKLDAYVPWCEEQKMKNGCYITNKGVKYEICNNQIMVEHENGYYGCLYGKSSMSIFKDNKEVLHTGFRNINTPDDLYEILSEMPSFTEKLANIDFDDEEEDDI